MTTEQNEMNPSLEATVYSLRETVRAMAMLDAEAERLVMQRLALANRFELGVASLLRRLSEVPDPPMREFPELNHKGD